MKQQTAATPKTPRKKGPQGLKDRVHKHLTDKNDVITEEDLKNVKVGEEAFTEEETARQTLAEDLRKNEELTDAIEDRKTTSSWDILSEEDK